MNTILHQSVNQTDLTSGDAEPAKSTDTSKMNGNERNRLNGTARKRHKYHIKHGFPPEDARQKAVDLIKRNQSPTKNSKDLDVIKRLQTVNQKKTNKGD